MIDWQALYASRVSRIQSSDVREQAKLMGQADVISFGGGIPDPAVFPHEEAAEAASSTAAKAQAVNPTSGRHATTVARPHLSPSSSSRSASTS